MKMPLALPAAGREYTGLAELPAGLQRQVMRMTDFEILYLVFIVIGLLFTAYTLGKGNRK